MIAVERRTGLAMLTMDDGRVNALDLEVLTDLTASLREIRTPVVITGAGKAFSAGVDLRRIVNDDRGDYVGDFLAALSEAFLAVFTHPYPVVAAVNGHAIAGGCIIALAADYRLMSAGTIGVTEVAVGVPFPVAALEICRYALGPTVSAAALLAEAVPASRAKAAGFAHELTSPGELLDRARDVAGSLGAHAPGAYQLTKQQLQRPTLQAIAAQAEQDAAVVDLWRAPETRERLTRVLESLHTRNS
jgi:enoyl-CoA hydratase